MPSGSECVTEETTMRIGQLRDYLEALIAAGIDPCTPVCMHDEVPASGAIEIDDAALLKGLFREDPAPKLCGFLSTDGTFLMLKSSIDYDPMLNCTSTKYVEVETGVVAPEKSWPNGHWFTQPRRQAGQL
jgi:hypothetical protein